MVKGDKENFNKLKNFSINNSKLLSSVEIGLWFSKSGVGCPMNPWCANNPFDFWYIKEHKITK